MKSPVINCSNDWDLKVSRDEDEPALLEARFVPKPSFESGECVYVWRRSWKDKKWVK
jgi:hypothetical protein